MAELETARLRLRYWNDDDVDAWAEMNADPNVMQFFSGPVDRDESRTEAAMLRAELVKQGYGWWVVEVKGAPGFSGVLVLDDIRFDAPFAPHREITWRFPVHAWGHGYASEGARALIAYAFDTLRWDEVVSFTAETNARSRMVMERIGMSLDPSGSFDHPEVDESNRRHVLYRIRAADPR